MSSFNLAGINTALNSISRTGVSFEGKAKKWDNADDAKELIEEIHECKNLLYLNLEGNSLGVEAAKAIAEALKTHPELMEALWKDLFTGRLKTEIPLALKTLGEGMLAAGTKLVLLDCSDNALGPNGMVGLVDLLQSPVCYSLETLKLNNCGLGIQGGKMLAKALLNCHKESLKAGRPFKLKTFIAGRNRLENPGATALAEVFETLKSLEEIAMPQNGIYHAGISELSRALMVNPDMKILNLNDNTIGVKGCEALIPAIEKMQNLCEVNFGDCLIKTEGAVYIGSALAEGHINLEILNLEFNEIGSRGGRIISTAMENKINLKALLLNGNKFGQEFRDEIISDLASFDRATVLGSLSEDDSADDDEEDEGGSDEGEEEEDEEDDYEDEDEEGEEEEDEAEEEPEKNVIKKDVKINESLDSTLDTSSNSISFVNQEELPSTIESFVRLPNPTVEVFDKILENNKLEGFRKFLSSIPTESYVPYTVFTILKLSAISQSSKAALEISNELYKDVFDFGKKTNQEARIANFFLIQLGLLKTEERLFRPAYNVTACRMALIYAIEKNSIPEEQTTIFQCFLERFQM